MGEKRVGEDSGYIFAGPIVERKRKDVKPGVVLIDNHRNGVIVTENSDSPWHKATYYTHGSILSDAEGKFIRQVAFCETIDSEGDVTWSILWEPSKGKASYHFVVGTGKWEGIRGEGVTLGSLMRRTDDYHLLRSEIHWRIDNIS